MHRLVILALLLTLAPVARSQIVVVTGGSSSLYQSTGASATVYTRDTTTSFGLGVLNGQVHYGAGTYFMSHGYEISLGDVQLGFAGNGGFVAAARGVGVRKKWDQKHHNVVAFFVGGISPTFSSPYFIGYSAQHFGSGFSFDRDFTKSIHFNSLESVQGSWRTALQSITVTRTRFGLQASGGLLQNVKTVGASGTYQIIKNVSVSGGHSNLFLYNPTTPNDPQHVSLNSLGVYATEGPLNLHAFHFDSKANGIAQSGNGTGAGLNFRMASVSADYFTSKSGSPVFTGSILEHLGRHFSLQQFISSSAGQRSINYGGSYTSNRMMFSLGYQTLYYPFAAPGRSPFQQVVTVGLSFHAPHSSTINLGTVALPNGRVMYAAGANSWFEGPLAAGTTGVTKHEGSNGKEEFVGYVRLADGSPIEGAAVLVGKEEAFTDATGQFKVRSKSKVATLRILPADFTTPLDYDCVSCPEKIASGVEATIVVRKK